MTDDLVKRLRKVEPDTPGERTRWYRNPDGPEAANEIEYLKRIIANLLDDGDEVDRAAARLALEKKDD